MQHSISGHSLRAAATGSSTTALQMDPASPATPGTSAVGTGRDWGRIGNQGREVIGLDSDAMAHIRPLPLVCTQIPSSPLDAVHIFLMQFPHNAWWGVELGFYSLLIRHCSQVLHVHKTWQYPLIQNLQNSESLSSKTTGEQPTWTIWRWLELESNCLGRMGVAQIHWSE